MSAFARKVAEMRGPAACAPKTLVLQPHHFVSAWHLRPAEAVVIGLKIPSEREFDGALTEARRIANESTVADEDKDEATERAYIRTLVACSVCDPNNVDAPHPALPLPDDQVAAAFPPATIRWLFDELDRLHVEQSPSYGAASDEEIARLGAILNTDEPLEDLTPLQAARVRRYIGCILSELEN